MEASLYGRQVVVHTHPWTAVLLALDIMLLTFYEII